MRDWANLQSLITSLFTCTHHLLHGAQPKKISAMHRAKIAPFRRLPGEEGRCPTGRGPLPPAPTGFPLSTQVPECGSCRRRPCRTAWPPGVGHFVSVIFLVGLWFALRGRPAAATPSSTILERRGPGRHLRQSAKRVFRISWGIAKCRGGSCTRPVEGDHKGRPYIWCQPHEILKSQQKLDLQRNVLC